MKTTLLFVGAEIQHQFLVLCIVMNVWRTVMTENNTPSLDELINVNNQLYEVLKHLYDQLDHPMNSKLRDKEYILHNIHYSGALRKKLRAALRDYRKIA